MLKVKVKPSNQSGYKPKSEPALELISKAAPSVEAQSVLTQEEIPEEGGKKVIQTLA